MKQPLVTVVIPAYESERYLAEAIESVLAQTYEPVELVIVDDGSSDRSAEIAAGYDGVKLVRQENRGVAAARNAGVAAGSGEYLAFLDSDDQMLPERLEVQIAHMLDHPEVGCTLAMQETFVEGDAPLPFWARDDDSAGGDGDGEFDVRKIYPMSMVFRRELFESLGRFDEDMRRGNDDADLLLRLSEAEVRVDRLPRVLVRRRIHATNVTQDEEKAKTAIFEVFKKRIDRHRAERP